MLLWRLLAPLESDVASEMLCCDALRALEQILGELIQLSADRRMLAICRSGEVLPAVYQ